MDKVFEDHFVSAVAAALARRGRNGGLGVHEIRAARRATNRNADTPRENAARARA